MPTKVLDAAFLERCCVQLSSPLTATAPLQLSTAMQFLLLHTPTHSDECASALVYRVAWSAPGDDRIGAWALLDAALRATMAEETKAASRRDATAANQNALDTSGTTNGHHPVAPVESDEDPSRGASALKLSPWQNFLSVIHHFLVPLVRSAWDEHLVSGDLATRYQDLRAGWSKLFNTVSFSAVRQAINVRSQAQTQPNAMHNALRVSEGILDALWKLRRESPRPSTIEYLVKCFGLSDAVCKTLADKGARPAETAHIDAKVIAWIARYYAAPRCLQCDSWDHAEIECTATASAVAKIKPLLRSHATAVLQQHAPKALNCGQPIRSIEAAGHVLDAIYDRLVQQQPYETLLQAYDTVRRETTTAQSRAALALLVSYKLKPSRVALHTSSKDEDASASPTMKKVRAHLVDKERRIREYLALERAARILAAEFRGALPDVVRRWIASPTSFVFVPLGLSHWDPVLPLRQRGPKPEKSPEDCIAEAELPKLASAAVLAPHKEIVDLLCRRCLDSQHRSLQSCPRPHECPRDLSVAQSLLSVIFTGKDNTKSSVQNTHIDAAREIEDARKEGREPSQDQLNRLCAARALRCPELRDEVVPYCGRCSVLGHDREECTVELMKVLRFRRLHELSARVMPHTVDATIDTIKARMADYERRKAELDEIEGAELASKIRSAKSDMKALETLLKMARMREPPFSREMHAGLKAIHTLQEKLKRNANTQAFFPHGFASFVFAPTLAEEILFFLDEDSSALRVLRDQKLPMDDVMMYALLTHPSAQSFGNLDEAPSQPPLFPSSENVKALQNRLQDACLGLSDIFCEELRRSSAATAFAKTMSMELSSQSQSPYSDASTYAQIAYGVDEIQAEMRRALQHLRARRSSVADVPTVPAVHSAAVASPVASSSNLPAVRRSRSPRHEDEMMNISKAHRPEVNFVAPQHGAAVLHPEF